jgi:hypothetical protein
MDSAGGKATFQKYFFGQRESNTEFVCCIFDAAANFYAKRASCFAFPALNAL